MLPIPFQLSSIFGLEKASISTCFFYIRERRESHMEAESELKTAVHSKAPF